MYIIQFLRTLWNFQCQRPGRHGGPVRRTGRNGIRPPERFQHDGILPAVYSLYCHHCHHQTGIRRLEIYCLLHCLPAAAGLDSQLPGIPGGKLTPVSGAAVNHNKERKADQIPVCFFLVISSLLRYNRNDES